MNAVDDGAADNELPQIWQFIHPLYDVDDSGDSSDEENVKADEDAAYTEDNVGDDHSREKVITRVSHAAARSRNYTKLGKRAPRLGRLMRYFNNITDDEELKQVVLSKDPVTAQTILQWAVMHEHFLLVEYLVKRLRREAFAFDPDAADVIVYHRWREMRPELPSAAEVAERTRQRELRKAARAVERAARAKERRSNNDNSYSDDEVDEEDENESEEDADEGEPLPEELVYESLEDLHDELGPQGLSRVKRIGELGVYMGTRWPDGTKQGLGQTLFPNGDCYAGEYKANKRDGKGVFWWQEAAVVYCGEWSNNARNGYGRIVYPDGSRFLGEWKQNKKHGRGRYSYADGSSYDGIWVHDEKHGQGVYHFANGSSFVGTFLHNEFVSGEWRLACGTVRYVGNFVHGKPAGMGMFVHRGVKGESFQEEGVFLEQGRWIPNGVTGMSDTAPRVEMRVSHASTTRIPVEFAPECTGLGVADLVRAINFEPVMSWVNTLSTQPPTQTSDTPVDANVQIKRMQVVSITYEKSCNDHSAAQQDGSTATPSRAASYGRHEIAEVRIRPALTDAEGKRVRSLYEDIITFTKPTTRLLILLEPQPRRVPEGHPRPAETGRDYNIPTEEPIVIMEKHLRFASSDAGHTQLRLPTVRVGATGSLHGDIVDRVGQALRLDLHSTDHAIRLIYPPQQCHSVASNATESTLLYIQQVHGDTFVTLPDKLRTLSSHPQLLEYTAVPLSRVATQSSDAATVIAITAVQRRREQNTLPQSTAAPQRPPTPVVPAPLARPDLQPLYEARVARRAEEESAGAVESN